MGTIRLGTEVSMARKGAVTRVVSPYGLVKVTNNHIGCRPAVNA